MIVATSKYKNYTAHLSLHDDDDAGDKVIISNEEHQFVIPAKDVLPLVECLTFLAKEHLKQENERLEKNNPTLPGI